MKSKIVKIECGPEEAALIETALEIYGRLGMLQFDSLTMLHRSLCSQIHEHQVREQFDEKTAEIKDLFGYAGASFPGALNKKFVGDDCRISFHLYQAMRHSRYLNRVETGEQTESRYPVEERPAGMCSLAGMELPKFKITIHDEEDTSEI